MFAFVYAYIYIYVFPNDIINNTLAHFLFAIFLRLKYM